ncbi:MAG TPA: outer membrane beta-barrel protein, partial [Flavisolibacter sp.]
MKIILTIASLVLFTTATLAQNTGRVTGNVFQNEKPANGATVYLLKSKDSSVVKLSMAGKEGSYSFEQVAGGTYLVAVTSTGYQKTFSVPFEFNPGQQEIQVSPIHLIPASSSLTGIVVTASRPLIEQKIDRTIVNVDASITNIGTSALEVLEKSPGVMVDRDGNISLKGKDGVLIMVDGRPTQLSGPDLTNLLRSMNSSQLDQVEIMTNPPARYDASGTAGIINIKTKKMITAGMNGSASISYGQGKYPKTNEAINFNYRNRKLNFFTSLSHNYQKRFLDLLLNRNILNSNTNNLENIFNQDATRIGVGNAYSSKIGVDFFATGRTTLGAVVNLNSRSIQSNNPSITYISNASKELESITKAMVDNGSDASNISANLNFRNVLDKKGREISSDIDYVKYNSENDLFMVNSYTDADGNPFRKADSLTGDLPQDINVYSARLDYLHPIKKDMRFEAGIKSSIVNTDNNARYDSIQDGKIIHDFNRSNHFIYKENINAAYVNLSAPLSKKITAQLGLRLENTNAKGRQKSTGQNFDRHYT